MLAAEAVALATAAATRIRFCLAQATRPEPSLPLPPPPTSLGTGAPHGGEGRLVGPATEALAEALAEDEVLAGATEALGSLPWVETDGALPEESVAQLSARTRWPREKVRALARRYAVARDRQSRRGALTPETTLAAELLKPGPLSSAVLDSPAQIESLILSSWVSEELLTRLPGDCDPSASEYFSTTAIYELRELHFPRLTHEALLLVILLERSALSNAKDA